MMHHESQGIPWEGTLGSPSDPMGGDPWEPTGSHGRGPLGAQGSHGRGTLGSPRDPTGWEPLGAQGIPWEGNPWEPMGGEPLGAGAKCAPELCTIGTKWKPKTVGQTVFGPSPCPDVWIRAFVGPCYLFSFALQLVNWSLLLLS